MKRAMLYLLTLGVAVVLATALTPGSARAAPGDLFVSDLGSGTILKFTPGGTKSTFASGLGNPTGLAFDSAGNLYEADYNNGHGPQIYRFTPGGTQSTFASIAAGVSDLFGLAFDSAGNLFAADFGSGTILKFTAGGTKSTFASGLHNPIGLAFDSAGDLFEVDKGIDTIFEFTPGGTKSTFASGLNIPQFDAFQPVAVVPEPSTWALLVVGGASLFAFRLFTTRRPRLADLAVCQSLAEPTVGSAQ